MVISPWQVVIQNNQALSVSTGPDGVYPMDDKERTKVELIETTEALQRHAEQKIVKSEQSLRTILSASAIGIGLVTDRVIEWVNEFMCRMLGYSLQEFQGRNSRFLYESDEEYERAGRALYREGRVETRFVRKDGSIIDTALHVSSTDSYSYILTVMDITKQKQTEEALKESEEQYRTVIECSNDGVALVRGDTYLYVNRKFVEIFGYDSPSDIIGKPTFMTVHPDDLERVSDINAGRREGKPVPERYEFKGIKKDRTPIYIEVSAAAMAYKGAPVSLLCLRDITEHRLAEELLRAAEEKYRGIFENAIEGIFQCTPEGCFLSINPVFAKIYGYESHEEIVASKANTMPQLYINPEDWKRFREILDQYDSIEGNETQQVCRDGTKIWVSTNARAVRDPKGNLLYYEGTIEDVTQRKYLESQLLQAQKLEAIGTLAGGIAHDFNNILTAVIGYGSLIHARMADSDPLRIYLDQLLSSSQKAVNLTQSLLVFSRKQVVELRPHKINKIVRGMEKILRRLLTEDIDFRVKTVEKDITVMVDVTQIDQVLLNLITNARDAMPEGGDLTIETREVRIDEEFARVHGYGEPGSYALISVSDTGTGMDERTKAKIFEPFFTTKESGKGTGLGLSIVYGIIKQHGGYIDVLSEPGEGTIFHIYFPSVKTKSEELTHAPTDVKGGTETVLVAEDNSDIRGVLKEVLGSKGYAVIEAKDGEDALRKFMEYQDAIDLVILDVVMPKRNGRQVCDEIRRAKAHVKVLFTSGYTGEVIIDKGVRGKAVDFIAKPVAPDDLLVKVRKVLDGR